MMAIVNRMQRFECIYGICRFNVFQISQGKLQKSYISNLSLTLIFIQEINIYSFSFKHSNLEIMYLF